MCPDLYIFKNIPQKKNMNLISAEQEPSPSKFFLENSAKNLRFDRQGRSVERRDGRWEGCQDFGNKLNRNKCTARL